MRIVIDAIPVQAGSAAIVVENLLAGWQQLDVADEIHLVGTDESTLVVPPAVAVHRVPLSRRGAAGRLRAQSFDLPKLCRELNAEVMLGAVPVTTMSPLPCPRAIIAYDLRHELRPHQFSAAARAQRAVSYGIAFRQADGIMCISDRTRQDLLASRPWLRSRPVIAAPLGADHVDGWPKRQPDGDYAIAFGHFGNKNVGLVLDGWARLNERDEALPLVICGLGTAGRETVQASVDALGLHDLVTLAPWLPDEEFAATFASAAMVVFPSDFEGFGLPAAEAMRLGIPLVVTPDAALLEVTGSHAAVMAGWGPEALAAAVVRAAATTEAELQTARDYIAGNTWAHTAELTRAMLTATQRPN